MVNALKSHYLIYYFHIKTTFIYEDSKLKINIGGEDKPQGRTVLSPLDLVRIKHVNTITVMVLSFRTDRPGQTV